jgi:oligogalacturonide lyase
MLTLHKNNKYITDTSDCTQADVWTLVLPLLALVLLIAFAPNSFGQTTTPVAAQTESPAKTWIDTVTGHRVTRLSDDPNSRGLYFVENAYTSDGLDMIYVSPKGIYDLNLSSFVSTLIVSGRVSSVVVGTKTRKVFYQNDSDGYYYDTDIDSKLATRLHPLPVRGLVSSMNADETLLVGKVIEGSAPQLNVYEMQALDEANKSLADNRQANITARTSEIVAHPEQQKVTGHEADEILAKAIAEAAEKRFESHTPEDIFTQNLQTGEVKIILQGTDWLNHVQFSPTDLTLIMYDHEGPALKVDRVWTIRADGSQNHLVHMRSNPDEIVTHEFWSHDGKTIWFDLQKTKGEEFYLGGYNVETGKEITYPVEKGQASVHYNIAFGDKKFCGDGTVGAHELKASGVGHRMMDRAWIRSFRIFPDGSLHSTRLVDLSANDYKKSEPNARFSPDNKLVIFTSNMFGPNYVFAVEVAKSAKGSDKQDAASN